MSLPRLDLSALTHNAAHWPLPGKVLLGGALAGLLFVVGDLVYLSPSREQLHQGEVREVVMNQQIKEKTALAGGLEERALQLERMQAQVDGLFQALPAESEMPGLLEDIARLALANGLLVESVTPLDEQPQAFYVEQPVAVGVSGTYHDLAMFVSALGGLSRFATAHEVVLRPEGRLLRLELLVRSYWRTSAGGRQAEPIRPGARFVYDPAGLRDPFTPLAVQANHARGRPALAPDPARPRGVLETFAVDQFEMVGTLSRGVQAFVLLRMASTVHRLAVGDYLGRDHGRVTAIYPGHVELVELFPDEQGAWLERPRTLVLNVNS